MKKKRKKAGRRKHWYFMHYQECAVCGMDDSYRERRYGKKPKDPNKRCGFSQFACGTHFL